MDIIFLFFKVLDINPKIVYSSSLNLKELKGELILEILKKMKATQYLSGQSGGEYLDEKDFENNNISLKYLNF